MSPRTFTLGTLPLVILLVTSACSDSLGPSAGQISARRGADDPPGDNRGVDLTPHFRRSGTLPEDGGVDAPKAGGKDDPANHT